MALVEFITEEIGIIIIMEEIPDLELFKVMELL
jgi:hypothetical protein